MIICKDKMFCFVLLNLCDFVKSVFGAMALMGSDSFRWFQKALGLQKHNSLRRCSWFYNGYCI